MNTGMISLLLRNLLFTILQPGIVAGLIPYLILRGRAGQLLPENFSTAHYAGAVLMVVGFSIMAACILRFATEGKGTLSPLDPTKKLVVRGLYRYSRNPMYVGVMILLLGESLFWWSIALAGYAAVVFVGFNLFILLHEEPRLRREFGQEYESYFREVRRWI
jgi:protein-S-isoprenylcysteine O-methyltransferase Ste14